MATKLQTRVRKAVGKDVDGISRLIEKYKFEEDGSGFLLPIDKGLLAIHINNGDFLAAD